MTARRSHSSWTALGALILAFALLSSCGRRGAEIIPTSVLFGPPEKTQARIAPDGDRLAYIAPLDGVANVWVRTLGEVDDRPVTDDAGRGVPMFFWADDGEQIVYLSDSGGGGAWRLHSVAVDSGEKRDLIPHDGAQVRIIDRSSRLPNTVIIGMNLRDPRLFDVYRLDLETGDVTMVGTNPGNIVGWLCDYDLQVRGAMAAVREGGFEFMVRSAEGAPWESLVTWHPEDNLSSGPVGFTKDGRSAYLIDSRGSNAGRLVAMDVATRDVSVIAADPLYDVEDVMINPDTQRVEAVAFTRARTEWSVIDDAVRADFDAIRGLDEGDFKVISRDTADVTWLVAFAKDAGPASYYVLDRNTKRGTFLFEETPELAEHALAPMEPISFESRDGLTIHGYITYPLGLGRANLPMVLNVHGGPWLRDTWGYDAEAQWLANRGYAHLQVNFRGSAGYGKAFVNAGNKEWGGKMHEDLVDAVSWAVEQGIADPGRVAIYGGSYGGYAALVGAAFTPEVFACAVSMMGPSNLISFVGSVPPYWEPMLDVAHRRIGDPATEEQLLRERSPFFSADKITIPLLVAQGGRDPRVRREETESMLDVVTASGVDCEYVLFPDEAHGFSSLDNKLRFCEAVERFLAKHLGGRVAAARTQGPPG